MLGELFAPRKGTKVDEFPPEQRRASSVQDKDPVGECGGKIYAIQSLCTHLSNPLFTGKLQGSPIWCDKHWASFDGRTGS
jgi:nitrite reductase/ring-hydroxylating ferredoxin subunit